MTERFSHRRVLSDHEIELWLHVTRGVTLLPGHKPPILPPRPPAATPPAPKASASPEPTPSPSPPPKTTRPPLAPLDRKLKQRLARGRIEIEAAIDLHGMRQAEAHGALLGFLRRSQADGAKFVLVVTGKGKVGILDETGMEREAGVLRRVVPLWLRAPELRSLVVGFEAAAPAHGGAGALYVRLRRGGSDRLP